jgi:hypothetical protein
VLISSDGVTYYDGNSAFTGAGAIPYSDSTKLYILTNVSSGTIYYKLVCSWIDDYDTSDPAITPVFQPVSGTPIFDSRDNYQKIFKQGVFTASSLAADNLATIDHNLGYSPNYKLYIEAFSGQVWPESAAGVSNFWNYDPNHQSEVTAITTTSQLKMDCFLPASGHTTRVWYRIYLDA